MEQEERKTEDNNTREKIRKLKKKEGKIKLERIKDDCKTTFCNSSLGESVLSLLASGH